MKTTLPVHPFPARMAPDLALARLPRRVDRGVTVLDPMMGSGTIPVIAALQGYRAIGFDSDPLAVTIARTNGRAIDRTALLDAADHVVENARAHASKAFTHTDHETQKFIDYWFDDLAQRRLGALSAAIQRAPEELRDALWCSFSRLIVTKDAGASRARDVSHSRPHRVRKKASFDPIERFQSAVEAVVKRHCQVSQKRPGGSRLRLNIADARKLPLRANSVDVVMTSPPYLQAIDYLRGHRMSLVWMGHTIEELRELRGESIGAERGAAPEPVYSDVLQVAVKEDLDSRSEKIVSRYISDMGAVLRETARVLRPNGHATFVVADAKVRGNPVSICEIVKGTAAVAGFEAVEHSVREIATARRYLPPPVARGSNSLDQRMRVEHCLTFAVAKSRWAVAHGSDADPTGLRVAAAEPPSKTPRINSRPRLHRG